MLAQELQRQEDIIFIIESRKRLKEPTQDNVLTETSFSITERGESSIHQETFYCAICMEPNSTFEIFIINPCNHIFCNSCITQYITTKVGENTSPIHCPDPGCKSGVLNPLDCQYILPLDVFDRWNLSLCESSLGSNKMYCPFNDCSALLIDERDEGVDDANQECPHCHRMFCVRCKVAWHGEISCEEFEKLGKDERGREDLMVRNLAEKNKWRRCPQCKMYVERIDGCVYMKCRCGYRFCYRCASRMSSGNHHCKKCNVTWDRK